MGWLLVNTFTKSLISVHLWGPNSGGRARLCAALGPPRGSRVDGCKTRCWIQDLLACHFGQRWPVGLILRCCSDTSTLPGVNTPAGRLLLPAAVIVALETLALFAFSGLELAHINADRRIVALTSSVFFFLYGAGLGVCAVGLVRHRRWARSPVVLAQLISLGVAWSFKGGETTWVSVGLAPTAIAVLVLVLHPSSTEVLYGAKGEGESEPEKPAS